MARSHGLAQSEIVKDADLPEPVETLLSAPQLAARQGRLLRAFCYFTAGYALLHKLVVPLVLSRTALRASPYAEVDLWFVHSLAMAYFVSKRRQGAGLIFLAGVGVVYGGYEILEISLGRLPGWLSISRFLSSFPMALVSARLLTLPTPHPERRAKWALGGFAACLAFVGAREASLLWPTSEVPATSVSERADVLAKASPTPVLACGLMEIHVDPALAESKHSSILRLSDCGFLPAVLEPREGAIEIVNESKHALNVHFLEGTSEGKQRGSWNLVVAPAAHVRSPKIPLGRVGMIYSDSHLQAGISAVVPAGLASTWNLSRTPLSLRRLAP